MKQGRGVVDSGVPDLASNPKHLKGFGSGPRSAMALPVEIYSEKRIRELDAAEAELQKSLRRKNPPAR